jgi:UDP-N-acetyl-D-mannosaminuronic acid dehydrogenase
MLPKIIGGLGDRSSRMLEPIVRHLGGRPIVVSSPELAEMCKLADNSYRAVNIAFANEIGSVCEAIGLDAKELVAAINEGYERTSLFQSGLGAGGPCLSKDPPVLAGSAIALGIETPVVTASIGSNIEATLRIATVVETYIRQSGIVNPHIALIGLAFKGVPETDDARGSPASIIHRRLIESCPEASFAYHDPLIASFLGAEVSKSLTETLQGSDVALFLTNHVTLQGIPSSLIEAANPKADMLLVDCWHNIADPHALVDAGKQVFRVGDGSL